MIGIYLITSPTNKVYVGQSWNLEKRRGEYSNVSKSIRGQSMIYNSLKKHGWPSHTFEVLLQLSQPDLEQAELDFWERWFMDYYRSEGKELLNLKEGGSNGKHSKETKAKISGTRKGQYPSQLTILKLKEQRAGVKNPRARAILQFTKSGELLKKWGTISDALLSLGKPLSSSKISQVCRGKRLSAYGFVWKYKSDTNV